MSAVAVASVSLDRLNKIFANTVTMKTVSGGYVSGAPVPLNVGSYDTITLAPNSQASPMVLQETASIQKLETARELAIKTANNLNLLSTTGTILAKPKNATNGFVLDNGLQGADNFSTVKTVDELLRVDGKRSIQLLSDGAVGGTYTTGKLRLGDTQEPVRNLEVVGQSLYTDLATFHKNVQASPVLPPGASDVLLNRFYWTWAEDVASIDVMTGAHTDDMNDGYFLFKVRSTADASLQTKLKLGAALSAYVDVLPNVNATLNIGSSSLKWKNAHANQVRLYQDAGAEDGAVEFNSSVSGADGTVGAYNIQRGFAGTQRNHMLFKAGTAAGSGWYFGQDTCKLFVDAISGYVGIGTDTAALEMLDVSGSVNFRGALKSSSQVIVPSGKMCVLVNDGQASATDRGLGLYSEAGEQYVFAANTSVAEAKQPVFARAPPNGLWAQSSLQGANMYFRQKAGAQNTFVWYSTDGTVDTTLLSLDNAGRLFAKQQVAAKEYRVNMLNTEVSGMSFYKDDGTTLDAAVNWDPATRKMIIGQSADYNSDIVFRGRVALGNLQGGQLVPGASFEVAGKTVLQDGLITNSIENYNHQIMMISAPEGLRVQGNLYVDGTLNSVDTSVLNAQDKQIYLSVNESLFEGFLTRDTNGIVLNLKGTEYSETIGNTATMFVLKGIRYLIKLEDASLTAADTVEIKEGTTTIASSISTPGTTGSQISFQLPLSSTATQVTIHVGTTTYSASVEAGLSHVDGVANDASGFVIDGIPSEGATVAEQARGEKSILWHYGSSGVLTEEDTSRAYFRVKGGNLGLWRKVQTDVNTWVEVEYTFAVNTDLTLTLYRQINGTAPEAVAKLGV